MKSLIFILALGASSAFAYIPEYSLILNKTAGQHGKGIYQIDQEVTFQKDSESYAIKESWLVQGEGSMRLSFEGRGILKGAVQGVHIYDSNQRFFSDEKGVHSHHLTEDWLEPLLVFRSPRYLRGRLISMRIAPTESMNDRPPLSSADGTPNYTAPSFLRLSRVGGAITYAIGQAPTQSASTPAVWIAQDQFVVRKVRTTNDVVFRADDYMKVGDSFWYPKTQIYTWGPYNVTIQTVNVKSVTKSPAVEALFRSSSLQPGRDTVKLPDNDALKEFFSRFR
jgi:hypothetical protein